MKINRFILKFSALVLLFFIVVISCTKNNQGPAYSYYVSKQLSATYNKTYINTQINKVSGSIPDVNTIQPLMVNDVDVYRIVYKTTLKGQEINASGIVCVPKTPGNYPVLSFQNGTNTVNAFAPGEFVINPSYQYIEFIASIGYIVVIADYPGFGESAQVPHPYLVKEPTVQSLVDMLFAVKELAISELPGITLKNEYYLLGYSQGGWATLALHKALELDYKDEFDLKGSACGAGPYDIYLLLQSMVNVAIYPMPVYLAYIVNAYIAYNQITNPVTDILNEPYASRLGSLFNGLQTSDQINSQLTTSIPGLITAGFLSGFATAPKYSSVKDALNSNSVTAWHSYKPLLLIHGGNDTQVNPVSTGNMYTAMLQAGTSSDLCTKVIVPGVDHGDGVFPCMLKGVIFLMNLNTSK
jgi:pimeloyl-ACP methyl ester carboxylesterase